MTTIELVNETMSLAAELARGHRRGGNIMIASTVTPTPTPAPTSAPTPERVKTQLLCRQSVNAQAIAHRATCVAIEDRIIANLRARLAESEATVRAGLQELSDLEVERKAIQAELENYAEVSLSPEFERIVASVAPTASQDDAVVGMEQ